MTRSLSDLRIAIDTVDTKLLALLNERAALAHEVGEVKKLDGSPIYRPEREAQVIAKMQSAGGRLLPEGIGHIWREIMSACRALEAQQRVAYLGPAGTFSEQAAEAFFGQSMTKLPCQSIDEIFRAAVSGSAEFGVIPLENSTEGVIARSMDLLLANPVHMIGQLSLKVQHNVLRSSESLEGIEVVHAHPQALAQCQAWLSVHLPNAERRAASSNAEGARLAATNPAWAGIASERAASQFGLHVAAKAIQDEAHNRTRFAVICRPEVLPIAKPSGKDAVSLVVSVPNVPGAMHDLLAPLKKHGVSMSRFESRPAKTGAAWDYYFFIDLQGHLSDSAVAAALAELQPLCAFFKVLGCYPEAQ